MPRHSTFPAQHHGHGCFKSSQFHHRENMSGIYRGPINSNPQDGEARIVIYGYIPSLALAVVGVVTFGIILAVNLFYVIRKGGYRSFNTLLSVGAVSVPRVASCTDPADELWDSLWRLVDMQLG
jgi:hypothetical protein